MTHKTILKIDQLSVKDDKKKDALLNSISFFVEENDCLGIFGPSGSGKTTLLTTLMRIQHPTLNISGTITYFHERDATILLNGNGVPTLQKAITKAFAYIPQNISESFDPIERMGKQLEETFFENNFNKQEIKVKTNALLNKMNLDSVILSKYPFQLSGGILQRCAIGLALEIESKIIIADEPTHALDSINKRLVIDLFDALKRNTQTTFLISTHDVSIIELLTNKVLVLVDGKLTEIKKTYPFENDKLTYLSKVRQTKKKISRTFWRLKNEALD